MNKNKKDYLTLTLLFQLAVCALSFGILFALKHTGISMGDNIKNAYFDNLERDFIAELKESGAEVFNNITPTEAMQETTRVVTESSKEATTTGTTEPLVEALKANVKAEGGADYYVSDENEIPSNVSVNSYTLNKKMFLPAKGEITSPFGVREHPISGEMRFHAGVDIANDLGTPIYSAFDGVVTVADYDAWNGNYLKILHDNEILTVYCHCDKLLVKKGDIVKQGEKIAEMGSTGSSTGPHLHFEFRIKNVSYDPESAMNEAVSEV